MTLAELHGLAEGHPEVRVARDAAVASPMVTSLEDALPTWGRDEVVSGHESPAYLPNILAFVADLGLRAGDDDRVDQAVDLLYAHQNEDGRFHSFGRAPGHPEPRWSSLARTRPQARRVPAGHARNPSSLLTPPRFAAATTPAGGGQDRVGRVAQPR